MIEAVPRDNDMQMLKVHANFLCDKHIKTVNYYDCHDCDYYYKANIGYSVCLKKNIKDWAIYHIENGE